MGYWFHELGGDVDYPLCQDCKVKMTAPLLEFRGSEENPNLSIGFDGDGTTVITICPKCHRVGFQVIQDLHVIEAQLCT